MKILKTGSSSTDKVKFLQEAAIMGQFFHPNIVRLHGVVTVGEPVSFLAVLKQQLGFYSNWGWG